MAAPVRKDEEVELQVDSLAYGGNGVARLDGFVVFVRRGLPGDRVRARVTKVKRGFAEALAVDVLEPSEHRVEAPCAHYPACGGCRFQDLAYEVQAAAKEAQVRDALKRIGGIPDAPVEPILPAASQFFYRNKLEYSFTQTPSGPALGFHKAGRWDEVLEIEKCWLTTDLGNAIRNAVRDWAREENLEAYDQAEHTGYLRHLVYREGRNTGQVLVVLVTAPGEKFERDYLVEVLRRFPEVRSIHWAVNDQPSEVTNLPSTLLWGDDAIEEELLGHRFRIRPNAFLQTNTEMAEQLYALAIEYAGLTGAGDGLRPLLRHRHDRALAGGPRAQRLGRRHLGGVDRVRAREPRPEPDRERGLLRRQRRPGAGGARRARRAARRGRRRPAAGRPGGEGAAADGRARGAEARLRLLQPDDARLRRQGAAGAVRLRAQADEAGRHVPAHAARRDRLAADARAGRPGQMRRAPCTGGAGPRVGRRDRVRRRGTPMPPVGLERSELRSRCAAVDVVAQRRTLAPLALQALDLVLVRGELLRVDDVEIGRATSSWGTITSPFGRSCTSAVPSSRPRA